MEISCEDKTIGIMFQIQTCVSDADKAQQLPFAFFVSQSQSQKRHCLLMINISLRKIVDNEDSDCLILSRNWNLRISKLTIRISHH